MGHRFGRGEPIPLVSSRKVSTLVAQQYSEKLVCNAFVPLFAQRYVEMMYDFGGTKGGLYAVIESGRTLPTNVRALDSNGNVVYQSSLPVTGSLSVPSAPNEGVTTPLKCGP